MSTSKENFWIVFFEATFWLFFKSVFVITNNMFVYLYNIHKKHTYQNYFDDNVMSMLTKFFVNFIMSTLMSTLKLTKKRTYRSWHFAIKICFFCFKVLVFVRISTKTNIYLVLFTSKNSFLSEYQQKHTYVCFLFASKF